MIYLFENESLTCVALEEELGLAKGDITKLIIHAEGAVELETKAPLTLAKQNKLRTVLAKYSLPRGKKLVKL